MKGSVSYALRSIQGTLPLVVTMLFCFASGLALDHAEHLGPTVVVLTVVMGLTLGRTQRHGGVGQRLLSLATLPVVSVACTEVGRLFVQRPNVADALFTLAISFSIWVRRLGPLWTRVGTLIALPFTALLVTPVPQIPGATPSAGHMMLWSAAAAVVAYCWVWLVTEAAERLGLVPRLPRRAEPHRSEPHRPEPNRSEPHRPEPEGPAPAGPRTRTGLARVPTSSRMALQMMLSLGAAFAIGRGAFGAHWAWIVLTAFIVNSGNRGRGDVALKALLRVLGAGVGTVVATLVAGALPPRDNIAIVIILIVLAVGSWLRTISYVYWAGCVTSVLSLLQGYFGEGHVGLIGERLLQIVLGGALAVPIAWWVLPVRSGDVLRKRLAECLAALTEVLVAALREPGEAAARHTAFAASAQLLEQVAPAMTAHRVLHRALGKQAGHPADAIAAVRDCAPAVAAIAEEARLRPESLRADGIPGLAKAVIGNITAARKAIGRRPDAQFKPLPPAPANTAGQAMRRIDATARVIGAVYDTAYTPVAFPPAQPLEA